MNILSSHPSRHSNIWKDSYKAGYESAQESMLEAEKQFPELSGMSLPDRKRFIMKEHRRLLREVSQHDEKRKVYEAEARELDDLLDWSRRPLLMERPTGPAFRRMRKAVADNNVVFLSKKDEQIPSQEFEKEVFRHAEMFIIEHDWYSAFSNSEIKLNGFKLPYEVCAFEFQFSGKAVIALATEFETDVAFCWAIENTSGKWIIAGFVNSLIDFFHEENEKNDPLIGCWKNIARQIVSVCIALDAEVAKSEIRREPFKSVHGKNNYATAKPYHVVTLARRSARPLNPSAEESGRHVRLHFRRGHWRHLDTFKTWVRWALVGDPDLGFVDKHYRL